ncbi:hypothetical protein KUCAC02_025624, partial [Chaenocephalus aceratus]
NRSITDGGGGSQANDELIVAKEEGELMGSLGGANQSRCEVVPLFKLADGEQDVRFTPAEKNGGKLRHKMDMAVNSRIVSPEKRDK